MLTSGLNDLSWALVVLSSFPQAMLIMSGAFGLWRAGLISNRLFTAGAGAVVLGVLGGSTWLRSGFRAPDGAYSRFVSPVILLLWVLVLSRLLLTRSPATRAGWLMFAPSGLPGETEARMRRVDGVCRWFLFRANPQCDASGRIVRW